MDVRKIGQPITASQQRSYSPSPDAGFYETYRAAFEAQQAAAANGGGTPAAKTLEGILGTTHAELSARRGVGAESQAAYAAVLNKAYSSGGIGNARQFLGSLSGAELEAVRRNHGLAAAIDPGTLSEEGAENLLLPEGYSVDLNRDGIDEVGAGRVIHFPPRDAPEDFKEAWFQATAGMGEGEMMSHSLMLHDAVYGMQIDGRQQPSLYAPDRMDSYRSIVGNYLASLEQIKGLLPDGQYERDKQFFSRLQGLLAA